VSAGDVDAVVRGRPLRVSSLSGNTTCLPPQGVRGRNSDNSRLRTVLGWEPSIPLQDGLERTYEWIRSELMRGGRLPQDEPIGV
jgi:nucleoside-diphosphate-sugar epimerase